MHDFELQSNYCMQNKNILDKKKTKSNYTSKTFRVTQESYKILL